MTNQSPYDPIELEAAEAKTLRWRVTNADWQLGFAAPLEPLYLKHRAEAMLGMQRFAALLSVLLYLSFFFLLNIALENSLPMDHWMPILGISTPLNMLYFWALYQPWGMQRTFALSAGITIVNSVNIAFTSVVWMKFGSMVLPPEAPVIQQFYNAVLMGLPFAIAMPVTLFTLMVFIALHVLAGIEPDLLMPRVCMIIAGASVGLLAAFVQEHAQRITWLRGERLRQLSERDSLTGLYNHRSFYEIAETQLLRAARENTQICVLLIDLDHFKRFNDTYGHVAGDDCLRTVAGVLQHYLKNTDDIAARLGGEEFAILLCKTNYQWGIKRAEHLCKKISEEVISGNLRVTASIGVSHCIPKVTTIGIRQLVVQADKQLYAAKAGGRNTVR